MKCALVLTRHRQHSAVNNIKVLVNAEKYATVHCRQQWRRNIQGKTIKSVKFFSSTQSSPVSALSTMNIQEHDCMHSTQEQITELIRPHFESQTPILLRYAVHNMPACMTWKCWEYLEQTAGSDTMCYAELGGNYATTSSDETRCHIRFGDYMSYIRFFEEQHGRRLQDSSPPQDSLVYLAQNDLPPGLHSDIHVPDFCMDVGEGRLYSTMIWIGPHGCVSPFHYDPLDNCFLQIVGVKRIWLFPPHLGPMLYAGCEKQRRLELQDSINDPSNLDLQGDEDERLQTNTSPINPCSVDLKRYPLVSQLPPALEAELKPGDVLFLPRKWWHYVITEETSISVNQWWR